MVGSDRIYRDLLKVPNLKFSDNALLFAEENPGLGARLENYPHIKVILYDKDNLDLAATFIDQSSFIFPASKN